MVEFWGIFVVFSACAAVQITEARTHNAHSHSTQSSSEEVHDVGAAVTKELKDTQTITKYVPLHAHNLPNSFGDDSAESDPTTYTDPPKRRVKDSSEESDEIRKVSVKSKKHLNLAQRLKRLYDFSIEVIGKYEQDYVHLTRQHINELLNEMEALPEKRSDIEQKLKEVRKALKEIDQIEFDNTNKADFAALESAMDTIVYLNIEAQNATVEFEAVLEKVDWIAKRKELDNELRGFLREFGRKFAVFIKKLTPLERLMSIALVDLQKRYTKADTEGRWRLLNEFWVQGNFD